MRLLGRRDRATVPASYAAVLDGAHLWLDLGTADHGPVSVRDADSGAQTPLPGHPHDLGGLTGSAYDVLAAGAPVRLERDPAIPLARTPLAPDGTTRWQVLRDEAGLLGLQRLVEPATAELDAVDVRASAPDRVHLRIAIRRGIAPGTHLLLLDTDDRVRASVAVTAHEGLVEALLGVDDLPAGYFGMLRPAVGTEASWLRIRRPGNDLADPHHAVLLPELSTSGTRPRARLRWNPDGLLAIRSIGPDEDL